MRNVFLRERGRRKEQGGEQQSRGHRFPHLAMTPRSPPLMSAATSASTNSGVMPPGAAR
jgi:hypothetical protein